MTIINAQHRFNQVRDNHNRMKLRKELEQSIRLIDAEMSEPPIRTDGYGPYSGDVA